jgi:hypothetical protein
MNSELKPKKLETYVPIVGTDDKTSPMWSLYRIVVLPAASSPSITTYI